MASLFAIREKNTNTFCNSTKHAQFHPELQVASLFSSEKNALNALKSVEERCGTHGFSIDNIRYVVGAKFHIDWCIHGKNYQQETIDFIKTQFVEQAADFEVVEVKLTIA